MKPSITMGLVLEVLVIFRATINMLLGWRRLWLSYMAKTVRWCSVPAMLPTMLLWRRWEANFQTA
ncbi:hypothetical protein EMPG_15835 [Blastomyces silverae]|uniref:Uncharacterized protein n=1 Tax=Blastomyces silverae TaxID=2060906 RepID=A0A0H1BHS2_9EURO|nr:hypothetical protein EMPG_15835 [Blastomyces silverae]